MATLIEPSPCSDPRIQHIVTGFNARIADFLSNLPQIVTAHGLQDSLRIHGSIATNTPACVLLLNNLIYLVSDIDCAVFPSLHTTAERQQFVAHANERLIAILGAAHITPGSRITLSDLTKMRNGKAETTGLQSSATKRGMAPEEYEGFILGRGNEKRHGFRYNTLMAPRDMSFALPYALLRFITWSTLGEPGFTSAIYELAKGINRVIYGDSDLLLGTPRYYNRYDLIGVVTTRLYEACERVFDSEKYSHIEPALVDITEIVATISAPSFIGQNIWQPILSTICLNWPHSILADRSRRFIQEHCNDDT